MRYLFPVCLLLSTACSDGGSDRQGQRTTGSQAVGSFCGQSSWVAGITELCDGHLVYRDYVYDDYGADVGVVSADPVVGNMTTRAGDTRTQPSTLAPTAGDMRYPAGAENTADLIRLDLSLQGDELVAVFELNTLYEQHQTVAALAIDTDNNADTGGGEWPGLGISSRGWEVLQVFDAADPASNLINGRLPIPAGEVWRVQAVVAQASGEVMNVAFRGPDEEAGAVPSFNAGPAYFQPDKGNYWEDKQAAALAAGDISSFGAVVNVADMRNAVTRTAEVGPGLHQRVYTSAYTLPPGEGVNLDGVPGRHGDTGTPCEQMFNYLGKYQPYAIYIPPGVASYGLQVVLHGCNANWASKIHQGNFQQRFGDEQGRILIAPNGRGPTGFYSDISERDVLDAMQDAISNYRIDETRVFMSGYSMGGYGAMRMASLYPDRFAGMVNWVGHTGHFVNTPIPGNPLASQPGPEGGFDGSVGAVGNIVDFLGNLRHVPSVHLYSGADYLVPVHTGLTVMARLAEVEVPNDFYLHPVAEHLTYIILDDWQKEAEYSAGRNLVRNPARVTYRADNALAYPEYGINPDGAYWVDDILSREAGYADVDLISLGCGQPQPVYVTGNDGGPDPLPWLRQFRHIDSQPAGAAENRLTGTLVNVQGLSIDSSRSCLNPGMSYAITSDGPATLRFTDGRQLTLAAGLNEGSL